MGRDINYIIEFQELRRGKPSGDWIGVYSTSTTSAHTSIPPAAKKDHKFFDLLFEEIEVHDDNENLPIDMSSLSRAIMQPNQNHPEYSDIWNDVYHCELDKFSGIYLKLHNKKSFSEYFGFESDFLGGDYLKRVIYYYC